MSEAREIAASLIYKAGGPPEVLSIDDARFWVKAQWSDWYEYVGYQMLDNIAEAILRLSKAYGEQASA